MKKILMLATRMSMGFGVSVVIVELAKGLSQRGHQIEIGSIDFDSTFVQGFSISALKPDPEAIENFCVKYAIDVAIAHTSPYFEALARVKGKVQRWVWEHGDPTPELFVNDLTDRRNIIANKRRNVYPNVDKVIAISDFIRYDIGWPSSEKIYNGCDHLRLFAPKLTTGEVIRVGCLMRMGWGEKFYKGGQLLLGLAQRLSDLGCPVILEVMGRGTEHDAKWYEEAGIRVSLNASDEERSTFLSGIDVFVSLSLWEGFNLPLVEAQVSGTLALALDLGAHPEVTPFIFSHVGEMAVFIQSLERDRARLNELSRKGQEFCIKKFNWGEASERVDQLLA